LIEPALKYGRHCQAQTGNQCNNGQRNQGQRNAVRKHDPKKNQQKRQIKNQRNRGAGDEFTYCFNPVQTGCDYAGGSVFEVARRQVQQVREHRAAEYGVDPVSGMKHEILADPGQRCGKAHKQK